MPRPSITIASAIAALVASSAHAAIVAPQPLNPLAFASIGTLNIQAGATVTIDTGDGISTPTLYTTFSPPGGGSINVFLANGTISNNVAVFDFDSLTLPVNSTLNATGALRLALLSRGAATFNGRVNLAGNARSGGPGGGNGGYTVVFGGGGAGIFGGSPPSNDPTAPAYGGSPGGAGGSFGGNGGNAFASTYGGPTDAFHAGSGGGGGYTQSTTPNYGGGGGGGLQVSALGDVAIAGTGFSFNGADAQTAGGGGSGGGFFLATPGTVSVSAPVTAIGGAGVAYPGQGAGGGGGGRILVEAGLFLTADPSLVSVAGGPALTNGGNGTFAVTGYVAPVAVPEPATLATLVLSSLVLVRRRRPA